MKTVPNISLYLAGQRCEGLGEDYWKQEREIGVGA
jgi:hypothetical protein